jgi:hypothetical protein
MVHFLRRKDSNSSTKDGNQTSTSRKRSFSNPLGIDFGMGKSSDSIVLLDYMALKLPKMDVTTFSLDPLYNQLLNNPCAAIDISSMPQDFMNYYDSFSYDSFSASSLLSDRSSFYDSSIDTGDSNNNDEPDGLRFGYVEVREYTRTVGDHPDVSDEGPPLALGWDYVKAETVSVCQYEARKRQRRKRRLDRRNQRLRLENKREVKRIPNIEYLVPRIKGHLRQQLLMDYKVPLEDITKAVQEAKRVAQQREESNSQSALAEKTEELLEAATRKLKKSFMFGYGRNGVEKESRHPYDEHCVMQPNALERRQLRRSKASISPAIESSSSSSSLISSWGQHERSNFQQRNSHQCNRES